MAVLLPDVAQVVKVRLVGSMLSTVWNNVFYLKWSGTQPDAANCALVATAVKNAWGAGPGSQVHNQTALNQVVVQDISKRDGASGIDAVGLAGGLPLGNPLPANIAMCVSFLIARRYRGGHPRQYWTGWNQTDVVNYNQWSSARLGLCRTAAASYLTALNAISVGGATYKVVNVSFYSGHDALGKPILRTDPVVDLVIGTRIRGRVDSQRRRLGHEVA